MANLDVGDRVALSERPADHGRITAILKYGAAGVLNRVDWETAPSALYAESDLIPCEDEQDAAGA